MIKQRVYVESTVWYQMVNYAESGFQKMARHLLSLIKENRYEVYISSVVLLEISLNAPKYREKLMELLKECKPLVLMQNADADDVARAYLENAYANKPKETCVADALHAAIATTANISYIASYDYRYLLSVRMLEEINAVNLLAGYNHFLSAVPPFMFLDLQRYDGEQGSVASTVWNIKAKAGVRLLELMNKTPKEQDRARKKLLSEYAGKLGLKVYQAMRTTVNL